MSSLQATQDVMADVLTWRRHLHQHPELSFKEYETADFVEALLQTFGDLEISRPTPTSVMARLITAADGPVLAMRADMDALPIEEETDVPFRSTVPNVMHACGHDGHTAMLLGAAKALTKMKDHLHGEIRFLFQHAEEYFPGGAIEMVEAGALDGVDFVIGSHLMSTSPVGEIEVTEGPRMAAPDGFFLTIQGKGGHGGMPHDTIDTIPIAAQVVLGLQQIVSRSVSPFDQVVLSIGSINGGQAANVIADTVKLSGTVRFFDVKYRTEIPKKMEQIIKGITEAHGATYHLEYLTGYDPVVNDQDVTARVRKTATALFGSSVVTAEPKMGAEDFSAMMRKAPGCYYTIGAGNPEIDAVYPHHHPKFKIDEDALEIGVRLFIQNALDFLAPH